MQKVVLLLVMFTCILSVSAQVSDSKIIAEIKKQEPATLTVKLENDKTERVYENGAWVNYYQRNYHSVEKTKWSGVTYHYFGGVQYKKQGSTYEFDRLLMGDGHYEGFAAPNKAELQKFLKANSRTFFQSRYNKIIGSNVPEISLVEGEKWNWHSLKSVSTKVKCTYTIPTNYTTLEKAEYTYTLRLYSDGDKAIDKSVTWARLDAREVKSERKVLETSTHSADEIRAMPTLSSAAAANTARKELASLPKIDPIPTFKNSHDLFYFAHNILMTKSGNEIRAYLYHLVASNCRAGSEINMMTSFAQGFIDKLVKNESIYKKTHCDFPAVKHEQSGMIELYDKEKRRRIRMNATPENGTWRINTIDYYPATSDEAARMAANTSACTENAPAKMKEYTISEAGFTVMMPKKPAITKPGGDQNTYIMTCKHAGSEYTVTAEPLDEATVKALGNAGTYQQTAINWGESFRKQIGATGTKPYNWDINGTKGIQTEWSTSGAKIRYNSIILDDMYYRVFVSNAQKSDEENEFFNSFASSKKNMKIASEVTAAKPAAPAIKVGTKVFVATTKGKIKARVLKVQGSKCEILYTDPRFKSAKQWVSMSNLSVQ